MGLATPERGLDNILLSKVDDLLSDAETFINRARDCMRFACERDAAVYLAEIRVIQKERISKIWGFGHQFWEADGAI